MSRLRIAHLAGWAAYGVLAGLFVHTWGQAIVVGVAVGILDVAVIRAIGRR